MKHVKKSEEYPGALVETNSQVQGFSVRCAEKQLRQMLVSDLSETFFLKEALLFNH